MAKVSPPSVIRILGNVDEHGNVIPSQNFYRAWVDLWTRTGGETDNVLAANTTADGAVTDAATAQTQADYSGYRGVGDSAVFKTNASGTQPTNNSTRDLVAEFYDEDGNSIATRTLTGTYTTAADTIAVTASSTTGEATTYSVSGDATDSPAAVVVHTASKAIAVLSWVFTDLTNAGVDPATGGGK